MKELKILLADSYILLLKTHNFHWNVKGPMFHSLHTLFEEQYNELFLAVDEIAERVRALGERAPGSYAEFQELSEMKDSTETSTKNMVRELIDSHRIVVETAKRLAVKAGEMGDDVTEDMAISRKKIHDKAIWMLTTTLEDE